MGIKDQTKWSLQSKVSSIQLQSNPYSLVINDVTYRLLFVICILIGYSNVIIDIVTAFLHGELEIGEEVYMECPQGMNQPKDKVCYL